jgi:hypothetical protein
MDNNDGFQLFYGSNNESVTQQNCISTYYGGGSLNHTEQPNSSLLWENRNESMQYGPHKTDDVQ